MGALRPGEEGWSHVGWGEGSRARSLQMIVKKIVMVVVNIPPSFSYFRLPHSMGGNSRSSLTTHVRYKRHLWNNRSW